MNARNKYIRVRYVLGLLTRTGVRIQDVANGEKLHVLSGERRERG